MTDNSNNSDSKSNNQGQTESEKERKAKEQEKRDKALEEKYGLEAENYERTSNKILQSVREKRISAYAPNPESARKQSPGEIADIHIIIAQQKPEYAKEGKDTSDKDKEKKEKEKEKENED